MNESLIFLLNELKKVSENQEVINDTLEVIIQLELKGYEYHMVELFDSEDYQGILNVLSNGIADFPMHHIFRLQRAIVAFELKDFKCAERDVNIFISQNSDESLSEQANELKQKIIKQKLPTE